MSRQNIFLNIPRPPGLGAYGNGAVASPEQFSRPMTSKQVRKAYKEATKTPSMTKAERRLFEKAEQERIRKELEKEKTAAKAKAARDKKRMRESAEREERKKNGQPLTSVRPSQDTIARFVRGNGSDKKRNLAGQIVEPEHVPNEDTFEAQKRQDNDLAELDLIPEEEEIELDELDELEDMIGREEETAAKKPRLESIVEENTPNIEPTIPKHTLHNDMQTRSPSKAVSTQGPAEIDFPSSDISFSTPKSPLQKPASKPQSPTHTMQAPPMSTQAILINFDEFFPTSSQQLLELQEDSFAESTPSDTPKLHITPAAHTSKAASETSQENLNKPIHPSPRSHAPSPARGPLSPAPVITTTTTTNTTTNTTNTVPSPPRTGTSASIHNPNQAYMSPPPKPKRFFTSSGSNEQLSLALQRSRRTAALEELHHKEQLKRDAGVVARLNRQGAYKSSTGNRPTPVTPLQPQQVSATRVTTNTSRAAAPTVPEKTPMPLYAAQDKENITPKLASSWKQNVSQHTFGGASQESEYGGDWIDEAALDLAL